VCYIVQALNYLQGTTKEEFLNILDKFWKKRELQGRKETRIQIGKELEVA